MKLAARMAVLETESAFEVLARADVLARQGRSIINLGIGQPDVPTAPHVVEAAQRALADGHHGYTPATGILALREAVAADVSARTGVEIDPDFVLITPGAKVGLFFAMLACGEPGVKILYPDPGFPIYASAIRFSGAVPVPYSLDEELEFSFRADDILARITPATRLLILNSPGNPTGGMAREEELDALVAGLERAPQVTVLSDEVYRRIHYGDAPPRSLLSFPSLRERLILVDGWSKTYAMTGWRIGWSLWPRAAMEGVTRLAINDHSCVNAATQWAGIAALQGPQDGVDAMVAAFDRRRRFLVDALNQVPGWRCATPRGAFYAFPNISEGGLPARAVQDHLLEELGIATIAGTSFGAGGEGFLRLSYAADLTSIEQALDRIHGWLGG